MALHPARTPHGGLGYLRENPNPRAMAHPTDGGLQYNGRPPDEWGAGTLTHRPWGQVMGHTTEGLHDVVPPDLGAESTANYLASTSRSASYHLIGDSDSAIWLLPPAFRAWHIANSTANYRTFGWAIGGHAARVYDDEPWMRRVIAVAAPELDLYRRWCWETWGIYIPLEVRSLAELFEGVPGFGEHGQWQADRSDNGFSQVPAWRTGYRPRLAGLWSDTFDALADLERATPIRTTGSGLTTPTPTPEERDAIMTAKWIQLGTTDNPPKPAGGGLFWPVPGVGLLEAGLNADRTRYGNGAFTGADHKWDLVGAGLMSNEVFLVGGPDRFAALNETVRAMTPERSTDLLAKRTLDAVKRTVGAVSDLGDQIDVLVDQVQALASTAPAGVTATGIADELARRLQS